jgi:5-hydroxyisourate hydrolase-like protein (transthyretin family)
VTSVGQSSQTVTLKVFDLLGREVAVLVNEKLQAGTYEVSFDAGDLPSGTYFYRLTAGKFTDTKKLVLMK